MSGEILGTYTYVIMTGRNIITHEYSVNFFQYKQSIALMVVEIPQENVIQNVNFQSYFPNFIWLIAELHYLNVKYMIYQSLSIVFIQYYSLHAKLNFTNLLIRITDWFHRQN